MIDTPPSSTTDYDQGDPVGSYFTRCQNGLDNNYSFNYTDGTITVGKKALDVTASSHNVTYGDAVPTVTCSYDNSDFVGSDDGTVIDTPPSSTTDYDQGDPVGSYFTRCQNGLDNNYSFNYTDGTITVGKKALDVTASSHNVTYGDAVPTVTCSYDNTDFEGTDDGTVIDTPPSSTTDYDQGDPVGSYFTRCQNGLDNNYSFNYTDGTITVGKKALDVTASSHSVTYGDAVPTVTCSYDNTDFEGTDDATVIDTAPSSTTDYDQGDPAGSYATQCSGGSDNNYSFNFINGTVDVGKKALDVTASSHNVTYGDPAPTVTCSYDNTDFVGSDDAGDIDDAPDPSTAYDQGDGVSGSPYATSCSGGSDNNYSFNVINGTVDVAKKTLEVTASSHDVTYGDPAPSINPNYNGFEGTDTAGDLDTAPTCSTTYDQGDGVSGNPYATSCTGGSDDNYSFNFIDGSITVEKKALDVTASSHNVTYGDPAPTVTCSYDSSQFVGNDDGSAIDTPPSGSTTYDQGDGVSGSPYTTSCSGGSDDNYSFNPVDGQVTVARRAIEVTADPKSKAFGDPDPDLTYQITDGSLVAGDSLSGELTRDPGETPGQYDITQGSLTAGSNYDLTYIGAKLTITQRDPGPNIPPPVIDETGNCLRRPVLAFVRGKRIKKVVFFLDGEKIDRTKRVRRERTLRDPSRSAQAERRQAQAHR